MIGVQSKKEVLGRRSQDNEINDDLLIQTARHDLSAFDVLYRRHVTAVYQYLLVRIGSLHDVQDLTAQTFLAALENIASYSGRGSFRAWLLTIARNKVADFYRARRIMLPLDAAHNVLHPDAGLDTMLADNLQLEQIRLVLPQLPTDRAEALALYFFGGLSFEETATTMGRSKDAVKMLIHRGLADLRARLSIKSGVSDEQD
jgi:RNA polymerase sigma-70 factor, ECF subfamily